MKAILIILSALTLVGCATSNLNNSNNTSNLNDAEAEAGKTGVDIYNLTGIDDSNRNVNLKEEERLITLNKNQLLNKIDANRSLDLSGGNDSISTNVDNSNRNTNLKE